MAADGGGSWLGRTLRYAAAAAAVTGVVVAVGWLLLGEEGRRGLALAAGIVLPLQLLAFGALATRGVGTPGLLVVWVTSTLIRFGVVGASAFLIARMEGVDLAVALLAMAGLFFVLLLLEPWALRERDRKPRQP